MSANDQPDENITFGEALNQAFSQDPEAIEELQADILEFEAAAANDLKGNPEELAKTVSPVREAFNAGQYWDASIKVLGYYLKTGRLKPLVLKEGFRENNELHLPKRRGAGPENP